MLTIILGRSGSIAALITVAVWILVGCQITKKVPTLGSQAAAEIEDGRVVFGKVSVFDKDGLKTWQGETCQEILSFNCPDVFRVYVYPENGREPFDYMLKGDGSFSWVLTPGAYILGGFKFEDWDAARLAGAVTGRIAGTFIVPSVPSGVYVGTTKVNLVGVNYGVEVVDEFDRVRSDLRTMKDAPVADPVKNLIVLEQIPEEPRVSRICSGLWGVACTKEARGVSALSPATQRDHFVSATDRQPILRWTPSMLRGAAYDVIVFEALPLRRLGVNISHIPGPIVEYARGVGTNRYKLKEQLKSSTKYFWSVRVRRNDAVSSWSTTSYRYGAFLLVAAFWGSGSGLFFNFQTP